MSNLRAGSQEQSAQISFLENSYITTPEDTEIPVTATSLAVNPITEQPPATKSSLPTDSIKSALPPISNKSALPPMLTQYLEYKARHSECVILFQVGDFYEIFFEDAVLVAKSLNLTLTSRDKSSDSPIPMCGVPVSSLDGYIERLVELGMSVAVVSQVNSSSFSRLPSAYKEENSTAKVVISRELTRIITPGIRLLGESNSARQQAFVMAIYFGDREQTAISYSDPQTGIIFIRSSLSLTDLCEEVCRVAPLEVILPRTLEGSRLDGRSGLVRKLQRSLPSLIIKYREARFTKLGSGAARTLGDINGFKALESDAKQAVNLLLDYIDETTVGAQIGFNKIVSDETDGTMVIGATTRANLELIVSPTAGLQGGLLHSIDKTKSSGGARLLRSWLLRPLKNIERIKDRYKVVDFFLSDYALRTNVRKKLELSPDLERISARIELQCATPRELGALRDLAVALAGDTIIDKQFVSELDQVKSGEVQLLSSIIKRLDLPSDLLKILSHALRDELPPQLSDGYIIREGFNSELDELRGLQQEGRTWVQDFERREQIRTGIQNLRVKFNYVLGFYIEVTKSQLAKVPPDYEKRQGTTTSDRFVTPELKTKERGVLGADEKALALERRLFLELRKNLLCFCQKIRECSEALSELDVLTAFAELADAESYVKPEIDNTTEFILEKGRHPVVESMIGSGFVPNSLHLGVSSKEAEAPRSPQALILTGPNMGGKSTFLRQAGILTIMAQMGSFVPAERFKFGLVDQIFARIGASDNIAGGESTFMVEMREVVQIISASTETSLILIDEVGRGTATGDGAALAQAIIEWLVQERRCRILFATHFHNLTELPKSISDLGNICVAALESQGEIIFTHQIKSGAASHSYGLEVAKLAGVPTTIIERSANLVTETLLKKNLNNTDNSKQEIANRIRSEAVKLSEKVVPPKDYGQLLEIKSELLKKDPNTITPIEALLFLSEIRAKALQE